jgi:hypothetical protein
MQCSDLRDFADSSLSDDSLFDSNHETLEHLELCDDCLREIADRENLRALLRTAVMQAPDARLNDEFAARLRARLRVAASLWSVTREAGS